MEDGWRVEGGTGRFEFGRFVICPFNFLQTSALLFKKTLNPTFHTSTHMQFNYQLFLYLYHYSRSCTICCIYSANTMYHLCTDCTNGHKSIYPSPYPPMCPVVCNLEWVLPWDVLVTSRPFFGLLGSVSGWFGKKGCARTRVYTPTSPTPTWRLTC